MKYFIKNLKCFKQWILHVVIGRYAFRSKDYPVYLYNLYGSEGHSPDRRAVHKMIESGGFWDASWKICFDAKKSIVTNSDETEIKSKYDGFDIEHIPHANRYFPRYKGEYLLWWETRQNFSLEKSINGCEYGSNEDEAKQIIDRYLELRGVGSNIISLE